jgi:hypothetical protein
MKWDLTGERVNGLYMGLFPFSGLVTESRVKYGGDVQYTVKVDEPFKVYGDMREVVLVTGADLNRVLDESDYGFIDVGGMSYDDVRFASRGD